MTAALDFGNTIIKIGIFKDNSLVQMIRTPNNEEVISILKSHQISQAIVSSVSSPFEEIKSLLNFIENLFFLNEFTLLPIENKYATPHTLGFDRIAAAVGAHSIFPNENCLIIDMGTAIKYDFINKSAEFLGGIISPGKEMRFKALHTFTKNLPLLSSETIPDLIGNSTESCIQSGVMNGIVAEINGIIEKYVKKQSVKVIICGGDASNFESQINYPTFAAPNLVLEGLNRILYYNVKNT